MVPRPLQNSLLESVPQNGLRQPVPFSTQMQGGLLGLPWPLRIAGHGQDLGFTKTPGVTLWDPCLK